MAVIVGVQCRATSQSFSYIYLVNFHTETQYSCRVNILFVNFKTNLENIKFFDVHRRRESIYSNLFKYDKYYNIPIKQVFIVY